MNGSFVRDSIIFLLNFDLRKFEKEGSRDFLLYCPVFSTRLMFDEE